MYRLYGFFVFITLVLVSCTSKTSAITADEILKSSMESTAKNIDFFNTTITFNFNEYDYTMERKDHIAKFTALVERDTVSYKATYENGYQRYFINNIEQPESFLTRSFINLHLEGLLYNFSIPFIFQRNDVILERMEDVTIRHKVLLRPSHFIYEGRRRS